MWRGAAARPDLGLCCPGMQALGRRLPGQRSPHQVKVLLGCSYPRELRHPLFN